MQKYVAIYLRVSSRTQDTKSQEPDLQRRADTQGEPIKFYRDTATGKNMNRPGWQKLESALRSGLVSSVVCWRIDRLGRTASGLTALFDELQQRRVNLVSLKDGVDLSTAPGRMLAGVLASVAQFEREVRAERQAAGIAAARASGKRWGGSVAGSRSRVSATQRQAIVKLRDEKAPIAAIARALRLSRPTIYSELRKLANNLS